MFGKAGHQGFNSFKSNFFKSSSKSSELASLTTIIGFTNKSYNNFFTANKMKSQSQQSFKQVDRAMRMYQMQLVRMSSTMSLILAMNNTTLLNPDAANSIEEEQDGEDDDSGTRRAASPNLHMKTQRLRHTVDDQSQGGDRNQ